MIRSAFEIAMEKAEQINKKPGPEDRLMEMRDKLKPLLAKYYKDEISADELWEELKDNNDSKLLLEAQKIFVESLGLRSSERDLKKRREGVLALESLKENPNISSIESIFERMQAFQKEYKHKRERITEQIKKEIENNSKLQMRPVQTEDGRTVMQVDSAVDDQMQERFNNTLKQLENDSNEKFKALISKLKEEIDIT